MTIETRSTFAYQYRSAFVRDCAQRAGGQDVDGSDPGRIVRAQKSLRAWAPEHDAYDSSPILCKEGANRLALVLELVALLIYVRCAGVLSAVEHESCIRRQLATRDDFRRRFIKRSCIELHDETRNTVVIEGDVDEAIQPVEIAR